jgi:hypothetical protein
MHEILHTYHFLSLRRKNTFPSFHASWRKSFLCRKNLHISLVKNNQASWNILRSLKKFFVAFLMKLHFFSIYLVPQHDFLFSKIFSEDQYCISFLFLMQYAVWCLCYAKWCDDVMLCKMIFVPQIHIPAIEHTHFLYQRWLFAVSLP